MNDQYNFNNNKYFNIISSKKKIIDLVLFNQNQILKILLI
jgi:hypothetical protein